jgi:hypothetical protein
MSSAQRVDNRVEEVFIGRFLTLGFCVDASDAEWKRSLPGCEAIDLCVADNRF